MVTASKLDNDRIKKLLELSPKECDEYIESLVLKCFKGYKGGDIVENPESATAIDKLNEFSEIRLKTFPNCNVE